MGACPCCKQELPVTPLQWVKETRTVMRDGVAVTLPPQQARVFDVIYHAHPTTLNYPALMERAWAHDMDGGPESNNVVSVYLNILRKRLKPLRVTVGRVPGTREFGLEIAA